MTSPATQPASLPATLPAADAWWPAALAPHRACFGGDPLLTWGHLAADLLTAAPYAAIPLAVLWAARRGLGVDFVGLGRWLAAFVLLCGTTHLVMALNLFAAWYHLELLLKAATAVVSVATAALLWRKLLFMARHGTGAKGTAMPAEPAPAVVGLEIAPMPSLTALDRLSASLQIVLHDPTQSVGLLHAVLDHLMESHRPPGGHLVYAEEGPDVRILFCGGPSWATDPHQLPGKLLSEGLPDDFDALIPLYRKGLDEVTSYGYDFMGYRWESTITPLGVYARRRCAILTFQAADGSLVALAGETIHE